MHTISLEVVPKVWLSFSEIVGALYEFGLGATAVGKAETENDDALAKHWLKVPREKILLSSALAVYSDPVVFSQ